MIGYPPEQVKAFCGIDPALVNIGFCSVEGPAIEPHLIHCPLRGAERLAFIYMKIKQLIYAVKPTLAAIEGYSLDSIARQHALGEGGGVTKLALQHTKTPFIVVAPKQLKKFVTGSGDAKKERMVRAINKKYGLGIKDHNLSDAVGLAKIAELYAGESESQIRAELEVIAKIKIRRAK